MRRFALTPRASVDLQQIWNYLAEHQSFDVADRVQNALMSGIREVADLPILGHSKREAPDPRARFYRVLSY